mmetsp:Transcript_95409/g.273634  ORF Transcript_95409/g.273634 Transcript_95409/m.273634 type:complete len:596 (-) Transcript_95409:122-1909(-)|eukprot:CAMPEP_0177203070 /NCGR_PEP_ID=MMETSP0367-20130122/27620_1 /TAXON_ID=447022 ORGANISM="Scrippsiella hangoei-like, Strain SHHI-4" /NCGR_SAMPLE_ID=MMETSP0367 /ASSEMBLY_ACC=CAM_ASM_000362 /LENGTH=595 /DNA_ID=CAMNT_0018651679 /DNA_START=91 /DNA_END=1878 /DNA_ORIENTATION=-
MKIIANCGGVKIEVPCGPGKQHIRWLGLVVATKMQRQQYPHAFRVPQRVLNAEGASLKPRFVISEVLRDLEEVTVELRQGAGIPEDDLDSKEWLEDAYGSESNLMECKFRWKTSATQDIPKSVRGEFTVAPRWEGIYPQSEYGGKFEIPIEPVEVSADQTDWVASRKGPPGTCKYRFVMDDGKEMICKADAETLTGNKQDHLAEFTWDVPIAPEPYPEIDSRPSTASSRDGAQVDPRFEQDWEGMRLRWVESFMKVRVKDVLTEFYAILIDLFDSYAFMGLDLSASQHTIGMDDWKHLVLNCGLLRGQPEGCLPWPEACTWFEEASGVKDARPYLAQRLTRSHYLELLMRTAGWAMCEHPRSQHAPEAGRPPMPLDEGLFRFITDILIPVMDVYDDDPIRKDAVQHQNLIVIQQNRSSIRSIYSFLAQPWIFFENEKVVVPSTLRFVFEDTLEKLEAPVGGPPPAAADGEAKEGELAEASGPDFAALLGGDDRLSIEQLKVVISALDASIEQVTRCHPEKVEERALLFWEFFEVLMQSGRELDACAIGTPLHEGIPALVQSMLAYMGLADQGYVTLPAPPHSGIDEDADAELEED